MATWNKAQVISQNLDDCSVLESCWVEYPHLSYLPVHIPLLDVGKSPCGNRQPGGHVNAKHTVVRDPKNLIFLTAFKSKAEQEGYDLFRWKSNLQYTFYFVCKLKTKYK